MSFNENSGETIEDLFEGWMNSCFGDRDESFGSLRGTRSDRPEELEINGRISN